MESRSTSEPYPLQGQVQPPGENLLHLITGWRAGQTPRKVSPGDANLVPQALGRKISSEPESKEGVIRICK